MSKRIREGYEPVRAEDYPDFEAPTVDSGKNKGVIGVDWTNIAKVSSRNCKRKNSLF